MKRNFYLSRENLKWIAVITMLIDHIGFYFFINQSQYHILYTALRIIGRISFPLFAFLIVEGFFQSNNNKYLFRLIVFSVISEVPYDLFCTGTFFSIEAQNVLFTFWIALLMLMGMNYIRYKFFSFFPQEVFGIIILILAGGAAYLLKTDYSYYGILMIAVMYIFREQTERKFIFLFLLMLCTSGLNHFAILSLPLLWLYQSSEKEKRNYQSFSFIRKYFFYLIYPVHMLLFYIIRELIR